MPIVPQFISKRINRSALKSLRKRGARIDRFKLTSRKQIRATLLAQPEVVAAVTRHAIDTGITEAAAWKKAESYIDEIMPFFNILAYSRFGCEDRRFGLLERRRRIISFALADRALVHQR